MSATLKDSLINSGDHSQVDLLTPDAQSLTQQDITKFLNGEEETDISPEAISSIRKLAKTRLINGQSVLPMHLEGLKINEADDNIGGGIW